MMSVGGGSGAFSFHFSIESLFLIHAHTSTHTSPTTSEFPSLSLCRNQYVFFCI